MSQWDTETTAAPPVLHSVSTSDSAYQVPHRYDHNSTDDILTDSVPVGNLDFDFEDHYQADAHGQVQGGVGDWNMPMGVPFLFPSWLVRSEVFRSAKLTSHFTGISTLQMLEWTT